MISLGKWLTDSKNGAGNLLARVIVNRLWHYHFGQGIVKTTNDFGTIGGTPSHPNLLDWLASELIKNEWKLKPIQKLIVSSATYRQRNSTSTEYAKIDSENTLLWHRKPSRLEAEAIRIEYWMLQVFLINKCLVQVYRLAITRKLLKTYPIMAAFNLFTSTSRR